MNKPHKHRKLIKAWADGASIQYHDNFKWVDCNPNPEWKDDHEYRIKPEPKKMYVRLYKIKSGLIVSVPTIDNSSITNLDFNWVSDWVEVELYSEDE